MTKTVQKALDFATKAHEGQFRDKAKTIAYITHPIAVRELVMQGPEYQTAKASYKEVLEIVSLLHDTVDDCDVSLKDIEDAFGIVVADAVHSLSDQYNKLNYLEKVMKAGDHFIGRVVKIYDNEHNISDLKEGSLKDKYRLSQFILRNWQSNFRKSLTF